MLPGWCCSVNKEIHFANFSTRKASCISTKQHVQKKQKYKIGCRLLCLYGSWRMSWGILKSQSSSVHPKLKESVLFRCNQCHQGSCGKQSFRASLLCTSFSPECRFLTSLINWNPVMQLCYRASTGGNIAPRIHRVHQWTWESQLVLVIQPFTEAESHVVGPPTHHLPESDSIFWGLMCCAFYAHQMQ